MTTAWVQVRVEWPSDFDVDGPSGDIASGLLVELGAEGIEMQDGPPKASVVSFENPDDDIVTQVEAALTDFRPASVTRAEVASVDWSTHWQQHFQPLDFGRLWVVPTWLEAPAGAEHVLWIDPSRAFGTGLHATTALCLERIVELASTGAVLDVGTGTGILALAARQLGAARVVGTDNDPDALEVAAENAVANELDVTWTGTDVTQLTETFDVVVANILAGPLADMAPALSKTVRPGGRLLLSGILGTQADDVVRAYTAVGLTSPVVVPREEWVRIELSA